MEFLVSKGGMPPPGAMKRGPVNWTPMWPFWNFHGFEPTGKENRSGCHSNGCGNNQEEIGILFTMVVWRTMPQTFWIS